MKNAAGDSAAGDIAAAISALLYAKDERHA